MIKRIMGLSVLLFLLAACEGFNQVQADYLDTQETNLTQADADVEFVRAVYNGEDRWTFHVTVRHPDTGWDDYTDGWDVVLPDGTVAGAGDSGFTRLLLHPHENEQPFTRSQSNILIPSDVTQVMVRAHDLVDGFGGVEIIVDLTSDEGEGYRVER